MAAAQEDYPVVVKPHPQAGKFKLQHNPDRPILSIYGGVGLRKMPDGKWTGYGQTATADVAYLIRRCAENGIHRICGSFLEEDYPSRIVTSAPPGATDYIAECIRLAHENNIEVYADQPVFAFFKLKQQAFGDAHPEYFTKSVSGESDTHMFSAAYPGVRRYKRSIFMEFLQNYAIDGLQLDFIRYPYYSYDLRVGSCKYGYDVPTLDAFRRLYNYDADYRPAVDDPRWVRLRAETVSQFIRELREDLTRNGVKLPIGVYNSGYYDSQESLRSVLQNWDVWQKDHLVEQHDPMILMAHGMTNMVRAVKSLHPGSAYGEVMGPLFLAEGFDNIPDGISMADRVRDAARRLIKIGCNGLWFCRASEIETYHLWPVVKEISQWSIKAIRAESFDPEHENLLKNGDTPGATRAWTAPPTAKLHADTAHALPGKQSLNVSLSPVQTTLLEQTLSFSRQPYLAVDSLAFTASLLSQSSQTIEAGSVEFRLHYADGTQETFLLPLKIGIGRWEKNTHIVKATTDFNKKVLSRADVRITLPKGTGAVCLSGLDIERDPLLKQP